MHGGKRRSHTQSITTDISEYKEFQLLKGIEQRPVRAAGTEIGRAFGELFSLNSLWSGIGFLSGYGLGANSYIRKPVDFDEFIETVGQLGPYWLLLNQQPEASR